MYFDQTHLLVHVAYMRRDYICVFISFIFS